MDPVLKQVKDGMDSGLSFHEALKPKKNKGGRPTKDPYELFVAFVGRQQGKCTVRDVQRRGPMASRKKANIIRSFIRMSGEGKGFFHRVYKKHSLELGPDSYFTLADGKDIKINNNHNDVSDRVTDLADRIDKLVVAAHLFDDQTRVPNISLLRDRIEKTDQIANRRHQTYMMDNDRYVYRGPNNGTMLTLFLGAACGMAAILWEVYNLWT